MKLVISISFFLCIAVISIRAQDSSSTSPNIKIKIKEPVIVNLKDIQAEIIISCNSKDSFQSIACTFKSIKNIQFSYSCYKCTLYPLRKLPTIGKYNEYECPDNPDEIAYLRDLKEGWSISIGTELNNYIKNSPQLFTIDKGYKVESNFYYLHSCETKENVLEIKYGSFPFRISFTLTAKCGFTVKDNSPQYPDTLYEGILVKDFNLENNNGILSIIENRKNVK